VNGTTAATPKIDSLKNKRDRGSSFHLSQLLVRGKRVFEENGLSRKRKRVHRKRGIREWEENFH
jgi:hypothetical protein